MTLRAVFLATPVLALGLACSSMGGSKGSQTAASNSGGATTSGHATAQTVMGRVSEATGDQLVIETSDGRRETLSVHQETAVTIDGQVGRAADLQPGQMVRASYEEQAGQKSAITIQAGHHMGGSMGGHAGDTGTSGSGTYQAPGSTGSSGTGAADTGAAKPQAGDTGTGAEKDTYQTPGSAGTGTSGTDSSGTGSSSDTTTTKPQAGDTGTGADQDTYQQPGSDSTGSSGSSSGSSTGGKW